MEGKTVISFANVSANYDNGQDVLSDVSFNISDGAFYFLTGPSGAGKTTLLRLIYQLHKPSNGTVKLFGYDCNELSRDDISTLRHKMAIVFQSYSLISHMTVFDNVALPLRVRGISNDKIKKLVTKTLEWVGLGKYANAFPMELFVQMNKMFGTTIILATHNKKLMENYPFPIISIDNHHVTFNSATGKKSVSTEHIRQWRGPQPQSYFNEISKQFEEIGKKKKKKHHWYFHWFANNRYL